jgi:hypothetical protein
LTGEFYRHEEFKYENRPFLTIRLTTTSMPKEIERLQNNPFKPFDLDIQIKTTQ